LRQPYTEEPTNWSRRYKANLEKLASGDVIKVAEVVNEISACSLVRKDLVVGVKNAAVV
jgi:RNA polymerase-interacting CarD/CdnL/TRCF family regulator